MDTVDDDRYQPVRAMSISDERLTPLLYQIWPGKNFPCCGGRCLCGPHFQVLIFTLLLIGGHAALFCVYVALKIHVAVLLIFLPFVGASLWALVSTACVEPGVIPRGNLPDPSEPHAAEANAQANAQEATAAASQASSAALDQFAIDGLNANIDCHTCRIYRPPRSKHCRDCDQCVKEFDHHCPWTNNCIGYRNYKYFVFFCLMTSLFILYIFVFALYVVVNSLASSNFFDTISQHGVAFYLLVSSGLFGWCLFSLTGYHCYLISHNLTTNEEIKASRGQLSLPPDADTDTDASFLSRVFSRLCARTPASELDLRAPASAVWLHNEAALRERAERNGYYRDPLIRDREARARLPLPVF